MFFNILHFLKKISLTTDIWTNDNSEPFLGVTAHYIDSNIKLQNKLLSFEFFDEKHTGDNICSRLKLIQHQYYLTEKVID